MLRINPLVRRVTADKFSPHSVVTQRLIRKARIAAPQSSRVTLFKKSAPAASSYEVVPASFREYVMKHVAKAETAKNLDNIEDTSERTSDVIRELNTDFMRDLETVGYPFPHPHSDPLDRIIKRSVYTY